MNTDSNVLAVCLFSFSLSVSSNIFEAGEEIALEAWS
jgi:hypothetical protein